MAGVRARVSPLSRAHRLQESRLRRKGIRIAAGVHASPVVENWYYAQLMYHIKPMRDAIAAALFKQIEKGDSVLRVADSATFVNEDSFISSLIAGLATLRQRWELADRTSRNLASAFVGRIDDTTRAAIERVVGDAMGVDVVKLLHSEGLTNVIDAGIAANVQLISSIPKTYLDKVEMIITQEGTKGRTGKSLIKQIQDVYPVTEARARFIARDQTAKLNGEITRERQVAAGIRGYRWRTVGDNAVRETHKERNGKFYAWNPADVGKKLEDGSVMLDPEADDIGNPGEDYQCRCIAEAVIEMDRI